MMVHKHIEQTITWRAKHCVTLHKYHSQLQQEDNHVTAI